MEKLRWLFVILLIVLILNIGVLYWLFFEFKSETLRALSRQGFLQSSASSENLTEIAPSPSTLSSLPVCAKPCLDKINNLKKAIARITPEVVKEVERIETTVDESKTTKEFSVYFGSATTTSDSWEDISGLNAYINSDNYADIQSAIFEVSLRIPTANGRVYARLYNKTDSQAIWSSELSTDSDTPTLLQSQNINLAQGNKLYQVQMKTTMKYNSILDSARLKIITK